MEQKKILWVILSVSLFVLVIFGVALFLYSPSRTQSTAEAGGEMIPYEGSPYAPTIDPDQWARKPDTIAELDKTASPAMGNIINLTIVAGEGQNTPSKNIDVSGLTNKADGEEEVTTLPKDLAAQVGIDTATETEVQEPAAKQAVPPVSVEPAKIEPAKPVSAVKSVQPEKKAPQQQAKPAAPKPKTPPKPQQVKPQQPETLYWVQTASLTNRLNAERARDTLAAQHMRVEIFTKETASGLTHRVRVGPFTNETEASYWLKNIQKMKGFENSFVSKEQVKK